MRDIEDKKNQILDIARDLFYSKGYENTSTQEIINKAEIARGTLYYHFENKERILDAVIQREGDSLFLKAKNIAYDKKIKPNDRLLLTLKSMMRDNDKEDDNEKDKGLEDIHEANNALLHQKINNYIVENAGPFLTDIIKDGVTEGVFDTKYPDECVEMILIYVNTAFDYMNRDIKKELLKRKIDGFIYNIYRLIGAKENSLDFSQIFEGV